jgi:hypothetical protein
LAAQNAAGEWRFAAVRVSAFHHNNSVTQLSSAVASRGELQAAVHASSRFWSLPGSARLSRNGPKQEKETLPKQEQS